MRTDGTGRRNARARRTPRGPLEALFRERLPDALSTGGAGALRVIERVF